MSIIKLKGVTKDYLWGGEKLKKNFHQLSDQAIVAESWVVSAHPDGSSLLVNHEDNKTNLAEYVYQDQMRILGEKATKFEKFPILVKLIDAKQALSVQVHPNDEYALIHEHEYGKNEAWVVLEAEPESKIVYGTNHVMTKESFRAAIEQGSLMDDMREVEVHPGDVIYIPAGTIHAIGAGLVICEVQQSSNSTYRVFDFNRRDKNGQLRELHIDKAIDVSNLNPLEADFSPKGKVESFLGYTHQDLITTPYFSIQKCVVESSMILENTPDCFVSLVITEGQFTLNDGTLKVEGRKGDSFFVPADSDAISIDGTGEIIIASL